MISVLCNCKIFIYLFIINRLEECKGIPWRKVLQSGGKSSEDTISGKKPVPAEIPAPLLACFSDFAHTAPSNLSVVRTYQRTFKRVIFNSSTAQSLKKWVWCEVQGAPRNWMERNEGKEDLWVLLWALVKREAAQTRVENGNGAGTSEITSRQQEAGGIDSK